MPVLASLHLYPVKGCRGISLPEATLDAQGLEHQGVGDREWMIVDAASGRFETQRSLPALARIATSIEQDGLVLQAAGTRALRIDTRRGRPREGRTITVWRHTGPALDEGDEAAAWLSALLGRALRLVRWDPDSRRVADSHWTGDVVAGIRFPDGFPLLLAGNGSLAQVNRWLAGAGRRPLAMDRFRPNLVIDGLAPFEEDHLTDIACGAARIRPVKPCTRCGVPSIDQLTG
ncbi:MAG: MOSC domain-containing protein, partial [bacterium]